MGQLGRRAEHDRPLARTQELAQRRLGHRRRPASRPAEAQRDNIDPRRGDPHQPFQVGPGGRSVDDDAVAAARCQRDQHAHAACADPRPGLADDVVDEVMDRHHPAKVAPHRPGVGEAVQEVDPCPPGQAREQPLLTAHPLDPVASPHRYRDRRNQLAPWRSCRLAGLPVHECREPSLRGRRDELSDQLARVGLRATGLARDEEDEVQADVHTGRRVPRDGSWSALARLAALSRVSRCCRF